MSIGCLPFLIMLLATLGAYAMFGLWGLVLFVAMSFILLQVFGA